MAYPQYNNPYSPYGPPAPTEEELKKKKEEEQKAILERIQTNRLYLKKVKRECGLESFEDLQKLQLFLFEVMIEALEVKCDSELNMVAGDKYSSCVTARVRFLNSPYLEICEKDIVENQRDVQSDQLKAVGQGGLVNAYHTGSAPAPAPATVTVPTPPVPAYSTYYALPPPDPVEGPLTEEQYMETITVKWNKTSGKSCIFTLTPLQMVQDLEKYPVVVQVVKRPLETESKDSDKTEKDKLAGTTGNVKAGDKEDTDMVKHFKSDDETEKYEPLGYAYIKLPEEFSLSVLQACKEGVILPVSNVHRANCTLENVFGIKKGKISVYIRLSTFGHAIITNLDTLGNETRYLYKPCSIIDSFQPVKKIQEGSHIDDLKPLLADEEKAIGISVVKKEDTTFKEPIMWNAHNLDCGCSFEGECFNPSDMAYFRTEMAPMTLPVSSELSLCRNAINLKDLKYMTMLQTLSTSCNWHNLLINEIQNGPTETCGCIPTAEKHKTKSPSAVVKKKPRSICTSSPTNDPLTFLKGGGKPRQIDPDLKKTHLGICNCLPGMVNTSLGLKNKQSIQGKAPLNVYGEGSQKEKSKKDKHYSCCQCCKCGSYKKDTKKKSSKHSDENPLLGYCGWPSPRSFIKKDPFGWDDEESKRIKQLLDDTDKFLENKPMLKSKDNKRNCGCISIDVSKTQSKKKKTNKQIGLLKPLSSTSSSSSDSDKPMTKMIPLGKNLSPIHGFGLKSMKSACECHCPELKISLKDKSLFPL